MQGISIGSLDRLDPPVYTVLTDGISVKIVRVTEEFITEQEIIPFTFQNLKSESLPFNETRMVQPGSNGLKEITFRIVYEDGVQILRTPIKEVIIQPGSPEIMMTGVQVSYAPITIPGKIAYLTAGNAWIMDGSTINRRPLVTTGDLDGRIFSLSPQADWLLFSRLSKKAADIELNTLWVINTEKEKAQPIDLKISNVIHFADWIPGAQTSISYSTVEPRNSSPQWQADNNLAILSFSSTGWVSKPKEIIEANSGGAYGWWGTDFRWSPDGSQLAYSRPDGFGLVDLEQGSLQNLKKNTPLQTHQDWTWIPAITWGADGNSIYFSSHAPSGSQISDEESPFFDFNAISLSMKQTLQIAPHSGIFTSPSTSPIIDQQDQSFLVAYLKAYTPAQSATSRYQLVVVDQDGSNQRVVFPLEGMLGLNPSSYLVPQSPVWAPSTTENGVIFLSILFQGDIWFVDVNGTFAQQITGEGTILKIDWK